MKDNGGQAFPTTPWDSERDNGMSLRDYFAAKVIQGMSSTERLGTFEHWAECAYKQADAMIKERDNEV